MESNKKLLLERKQKKNPIHFKTNNILLPDPVKQVFSKERKK